MLRLDDTAEDEEQRAQQQWLEKRNTTASTLHPEHPANLIQEHAANLLSGWIVVYELLFADSFCRFVGRAER